MSKKENKSGGAPHHNPGFLKEIVDNTPVGIYTLKSDGVIDSFNPAMVAMAGAKKAEEVIGWNALKMSSYKKAGLTEHFKRGLAGESFEVDSVEYHSKSSGKRTVRNYRGTPIKDEEGKVKHLLLVVEDVTERRHMEEELRRSEKQFHDLFDNAVDPVVVIDDEGGILAVNKKAAELTGYNVEELVGANFAKKKLLTPETAAIAFENMTKRFSGGQTPPYEVEILRKDGTTFPAEINARIIDFKGVKADLVSLRDTTERKKMDRMKEEFFSSVSHELKTPLTSMLSLTELMYGGKVGEISDKQKEVLEYVLQDTIRLRHIVDRIIANSKLELGIQMKMQEADLSGILDKVLDSFKLFAKEKKIELNKDAPGQLPHVKCDVERITDVLNNLVGNALKFTQEGGSISVNVDEGDKELVVKVSDTGTGIPEGDLEKVFEKYYQVDPSITNVTGGSGLGLNICKRIIEQHNGRIWAESKMGEGSRFYFTLPLVS